MPNPSGRGRGRGRGRGGGVGGSTGGVGGSSGSVGGSTAPASDVVQQPPRPLRTENLRPEDIEAYLDMEDLDSDEELPEDDLAALAFVEEPVFRYCEDDDEEVETPEVAASRPELAFQEWPPRSRPASPAPAPPAEEPQPATSTFEASATVYGPIDKFEFEWKAFPNPQVQTESRRENFSDSNVGPTCSYETPYDAFTAIWDQGIMEHIATETNRYAQQLTERLFATGNLKPDSRITRWKDTSASELYTFFAIILAMGIVVKSVAQDYWHKAMNIFSTPGFAPMMSYNRFHLLCQCLHFNDNRNCDRRSLSNSEMMFFKVKPIVHHLNNKFANLYKLSKNVSLDESLTMWKGWLNINQFIRNKASAIGIKTYELCESQTGYTWRFKVHTGQDHSCSENAAPVSGAIPSLVLDILKGLEGKGHTIWMDNYYNSPALARELKSLGFDCVGTLRTNRQFVPGEMTNLKKESMTVGHVYGCTSGDVDLLLWRDKNRVALISTYHGNTVTVCNDRHIPSAVVDYNVCMGGVDRKDALLSHYPIERKRTLVWYKKLFRRLLNVSTLNAFIMYNASHTSSHRSFRETLVKELLARHGPPTLPPPPPKPLITGHFPSQYSKMSGSGGARGDHQRRNCAHCKKRTTFYCIACNVALCVPGASCFIDYHNRL